MAQILSCDDSNFAAAGQAVILGRTIIFPTDTVYGLGSSPYSESGVARCFALKNRDRHKPLPVLFSRISEVSRLVELNSQATTLAKLFWPGSLTIVLPIRENVQLPRPLVGNGESLAVRIPNHECCTRLIDACGGALIGTSANVSGQAPLVDPDDPVLQEFISTADYFVRGKCGGTASSTIIDLTSEKIRFLRDGAIPKEKILAHLERASNAAFSSRNPSN